MPEDMETWEDPEVEVKIRFRIDTCELQKQIVYVCLFVFVPSILSFFVLVFVFYIFLSLCFIIALCSLLTSLSFSHLVLVFLLPSPSHFRNYEVFYKVLFHSYSLHLGLYIPHIADAEGVV